MPRTLLTVAALAALTGTLTISSFAAAPKNGALYEGTLYADGANAITKIVRLKVAASGKTARVSWFCGTGRAATTLQFAVAADGTFKAFNKTGSLTIWSFVGRFLSPTVARAALHLNYTCDSKGGTVNLKVKA